MGHQSVLSKEVKGIVRLRSWILPFFLVYIASFIYAMFTDWLWILPMTLCLSLLVFYTGYRKYRVSRLLSTQESVHRLLKWELALDGFGVILMLVFALALIKFGDVGFYVGILFSIWTLTETKREKYLEEKIQQFDPSMPKYREVIKEAVQ